MKIVTFSDIHFGLKNNSDTHNKQCLDFLQFVQEWCDDNLVEPFITIFNGDWYHNRNNINVRTMNYSKEGLITLSNIGEKQYMILGNHDLYGLNRRDITSIIIPTEADGIELIDEPIMLDEEDILLVPWLVNEETLPLVIDEYNPKYVFAHAEIPSFNFNKMIKMDGEYIPADYQGKRIISGHFHCRSEKNNITYMGNCFSHDFSDNNDWHNKGFAVLETETNEITYVEWKDAPKYLVKNISELDKFEVENNTHLKLINDANLDNKKLDKIKDKLSENENIVELLVYPSQDNILETTETVDKEVYASIDLMVSDLLDKCEIENINNKKMIDIFNSL